MNNWKVILATVVIFGAGVFTGGLLVDHVFHLHAKSQHHPPANVAAHSPATNPPAAGPLEVPMPRVAKEMGKQFVQQLNDKLLLTPEQRVQIEKIIAAGQDQNHEIWTNTVQKMRTVMQDVNRQIRAELTPEQLKPFEQLLKRPPRRAASTNAVPVSVPATNPPSAVPGA